MVAAERNDILALFETTFNHSSYTGRSGTIFAYEGLGSIYWHMVSKLLLAAQECYQQAVEEQKDDSIIEALAEAYYDIRMGIGFNKPPNVYGAFPTDPYSHTPMGEGVRQPGMTGQVKEEIITRWGELGVKLEHGFLCLSPTLLRNDEFIPVESSYEYIDINDEVQTLSLRPGSLAFTICQVPVIYHFGDVPQIKVFYENGRSVSFDGSCLDIKTTRHIFDRDGQIKQMSVTLTQ